jgi:uncharacterized protein (TIGR03437 family)
MEPALERRHRNSLMLSGSRLSCALFAGLLLLSPFARAQQQNRITRRIDNAQRFTLRGHVHPRATAANDIGRVPASLEIPYVTLQFSQTDAQKADLTNLLAAQQNPSSPSYHQWLTPAQYADRFGVSQDDLNSVTQWLQSQGLTVVGVAQGRDWVAISGDASHIESAFSTQLHNYSVDGVTHYANATDPALPAAFSGVVASIRGLHDFKMKPRNVSAKYTKSSSGHHYMAPDDFATIYDVAPAYAAGIDGTGQTVVVIGQTAINLSDIQQFQSDWNLPVNPTQTLLVPNSRDPGISSNDIDEADLDIEWAVAVARRATIQFVYSTDVITSAQYAIDRALGTVMTMSYGSCEPENSQSDIQSIRSSAQKANAEGITWANATGDNGAADCADAQNPGAFVDTPASMPEVTGVGGTEFSEGTGIYWNFSNNANGASVLSYIPEVAWNDTVQDGSPSASGGGTSILFARPSWQTGTGVPTDAWRHVPDIAMAASADHDAYLVYSQGALGAYGGTSVPTPAFAGMIALLNQYLVTTGQQRTAGLGNVNPKLYSLAQSNPAVFHDVTTGNNGVTYQLCPSKRGACTTENVAGYTANVGYDQVTGLGSIDAWKLLTCWTGTCAVVTPPTAISGLTDSAAYQQSYSPGMIMAVFGTQLSPSAATAGSVPLPLSLAGVSATVNGEAAPLYYVSSTQINLQIPWDVPLNQAATLVINNNGATASQTFNVAVASPGIYTDGNHQIVPSANAAVNQVTSLYLTGSGAVTPTIATGSAPSTATPLAQLPAPQNVSVTVGGVPASITCSGACFVGIPYGLVGVTQINFEVMSNTPLGLQPVVVTINGKSSPPAYLNITD